ncbi:MAG: hypothetical protein ACRC46_08540 [Thermoguttaceae bacterium]
MRVLVFALLFLAILSARAAEPIGSPLPLGVHADAIPPDDFPSPVHAFVFRNWSLVPTEKLAVILQTDVASVRDVAVSMGLPANPAIEPEMLRRGFITLLRRNWHLLPYSQLLELVEMTNDELAFALRDDDFLFVKLGNTKPRCDVLRYEPPTEQQRLRAAEIKTWLASAFGDELNKPREPRFAFLKQWATPRETTQQFSLGKPTLSPRYVYSYAATFGDPLWEPSLESFPEGLFAQLAEVGVDGVWIHCVLHQLAPGGVFPELGDGHTRRLENLQKLVERAERYGVRIYLYLNEPRAMPLAFFEKHPDVKGVVEGDFAAMCTSDAEKKTLRWLEESLDHLFKTVPQLGGVFTISGSENLTFCASHGTWKNCPRCQTKSDAELIGELHTVIERAVHRRSPDAKVIAWDWGWRGHGLSPDIIRALPQNVMFMSVSEWSIPIERGGVASTIGEYSISAVGPGPRATAQWNVAREHGLATVAKVQLNNTWELAAVPFLPVLELTARHCKNLSSAGVSGMMLGWSLGGYPSPNHEVAYRLALAPDASVDEVLGALAEKRYGVDGKSLARRAWKEMSAAFEEYPYGGGLYTSPTQMGVANPLYAKPTGYAPTMVGLPYDGVASWCTPYTPEVYAAQMDKVAAGWQRGSELLQEAIVNSPAESRDDVELELRCAQAGAIHFRSAARQCRFVVLRDVWLALQESNATKTDRARVVRDECRRIIQDEIADAVTMFRISSADARIGFEASNHYFYVPLDFAEKVVNGETLLKTLFAE